MVLQGVDVLERFVADFALVATLVRVDPLVALEVRELVEFLAARRTAEWLCKRVQDLEMKFMFIFV